MARAKPAFKRATVPKPWKFADGAIARGNAICHMKLGTANLRLGKLTDAQRDLEKAVQLAPNDPVAHYQLGKLYKQMKALDRAKAEFDRTAELQSQAASPKPQ